MGIYMPNMSKPKSCYNHCFEDFIANKEIGCPLNDYIESHQYKNKVHPDCPLIEVPTPHGRLVDIDKVKDELRDQIPYCGLDMTYSNSNAFDSMDNAPTILDAEE